MKRIFENALKDLLTSFFGALAGVPEIIEGASTKNYPKLVEGIAILVLGLVVNSKIKN